MYKIQINNVTFDINVKWGYIHAYSKGHIGEYYHLDLNFAILDQIARNYLTNE